jgi:hypothetical protein
MDDVIFKMGMRIVSCNEIADSPARLDECRSIARIMKKSLTPATNVSPWQLASAFCARTLAGLRLFLVLARVCHARCSGPSQDDGLGRLIQQKTSLRDMCVVSISI